MKHRMTTALTLSAVSTLLAAGTTAMATTSAAADENPAAASAAAAPGSSAKRVLAKGADPSFGKFNGNYFIYTTGNRFPAWSSQKAGGPYKARGTLLDRKPAWTTDAKNDQGKPAWNPWAPHVFQTGKNAFTLYFTAKPKKGGNCIGIATGTNPTGPFTPQKNPAMCPPAGYTEAIDASEYVTTENNRYMIYKIGNYNPRKFQIMAIRMAGARGTGKAKGAKPRVVLSAKQIGSAVAEAPDIHRAPDGRVFLFVSRNGYKDCNYATQTWAGKDMWSLGNPRWVTGMGPEAGGFCGPGGAEVLQDGKVTRVAFHAWAGGKPETSRPAFTGVLDRKGDQFTLR